MSAATHAALVYDGAEEYATRVGGYLRDGLSRGERGLVIAPTARMGLLRDELGDDALEVTFVDESVGYRPQWNAYRTLIDFAAKAPDVRSCVVAEQTLSARVPAELHDYRRLEAAINIVFAENPVSLLCPYDAGTLTEEMLAIGLATHGQVLDRGSYAANDHFRDPAAMLEDLARVPPPPAGAPALRCAGPEDLSLARHVVRELGEGAGLDEDTVDDVVLAVTEVLTNALRHGAPPAVLHVYDAGPTWVCHVQDAGRGGVDPLVGLVPPAEPSDHGYGLWVARQLCAAVDVGTDESGTHVRLHALSPR